MALDLQKGPIRDAAVMARTPGGKIVPTEAHGALSATVFPSFACSDVTRRQLVLPEMALGKVSLLSLAFSAEAATHIAPYIEAYRDAVDPSVRLIMRLYPIMGVLKWALLRGFVRPPSQCADETVAVPCSPRQLVYDLSIPNDTGAYVYLLDSRARIRWRASGAASADDLASLASAVHGIAAEAHLKQ